MTTWFISRHAGAIEWAHTQDLHIDRYASHLSVKDIQPGDCVIGTLPVHLAAEICARKARYFHLQMDLRQEDRGSELTLAAMQNYGATIQEYFISKGNNFENH